LKFGPFLTFDPHNGRSDDGVTVDTFSSLVMPNTLLLVFCDLKYLIFFGPLKNEFDLLTPLMTFDPDEK
jgi:hypothetical protein